MGHTGHVYRVKANSQEQAIKRVERYLDAYADSNIWYYIISVFDKDGKYTKIYQDETENFPETSEELTKFLIAIMKPEEYFKHGLNRESYPEINSRCIDEQGLTDLTTRCKKDAETFFVVTYIHA